MITMCIAQSDLMTLAAPLPATDDIHMACCTESVWVPDMRGMRHILWYVTACTCNVAERHIHGHMQCWLEHRHFESLTHEATMLCAAGFISTLFVVMPTKFAVLFTFANIFAIARWARVTQSPSGHPHLHEPALQQ